MHRSPHSRRSYVEVDRARLRRSYDRICVAQTERADATATSSNTAPPSRFPTPGTLHSAMPARNAFTVDLEDWYHGIELPFASWREHENRIDIGLHRVLELLDTHETKATFFTLGWIGDEYPGILATIAKNGHELASHGYSHEKAYNQSQAAFREEVRRTKATLEDISGQPVTAHRSPFFSITSKSLWALSILREEGFEIDSSISPIKTWRYGISTCPDEIFKIAEIDLVEFPVSRFSILARNWAVGGAYFRLFPYRFTSRGMRKRLADANYNMFYVHPWEYDETHPVVPMEWKAKLTHYTNLSKTFRNTTKLLQDFDFGTMSSVIKGFEEEHGPVRAVSIEMLQD